MPLLANQATRLIHADFGVRANEALLPDGVSLYQWQANWAFGRWQAQHVGRRGFMVMSMHESGYDTPFAFQSGFESAGGEIVGTLIPDSPAAPLSLTEVMTRIRTAQPTVVYALLQGQTASDFVAAFQQVGLLGQVALSGSPFALAAAMQTVGAAADGIRSWRTWHTATTGPLAALAQRTAQRVAGGAAQDNVSIYISQIRVRQSQPYVDSVADLGQVSAVKPLVFTGPRTGWLNPYL